MQRYKFDLKGLVYGRWTVLDYAYTNNEGASYWVCECKCGVTKSVKALSLKQGSSKSCGCLHKDKTKQTHIKHGGYKEPEYAIWTGIKGRCENSNNISYSKYGGRGISLCDRWKGDRGYTNFKSDMGERPSSKHSIDRINNDEGYYPENCKWSTFEEQVNNRGLNSNNKSGKTGVYWNTRLGKWVAQIGKGTRENRRNTVLGYFTDVNEAIEVRREAELKYFGRYKV